MHTHNTHSFVIIRVETSSGLYGVCKLGFSHSLFAQTLDGTPL